MAKHAVATRTVTEDVAMAGHCDDPIANGVAVLDDTATQVQSADSDGEAGDIQWNFEKFLVAPDGEVVNRFRPRTEPDAPEVISAIEAVLPQ